MNFRKNDIFERNGCYFILVDYLKKEKKYILKLINFVEVAENKLFEDFNFQYGLDDIKK